MKREEMLLSVIIPVYNGESYIDKCLNSVINQTYRNLEIIIINDGSKDKSLERLNYYKSIDSRIVLVDQCNKGSSQSRQYGIDIAKGDYITFVDIDDYIELNTYEIAMNEISDIDILTFGVSCDYEKEKYSLARNVLQNDNSVKSLFENEIFNFVWNKIYRSSLIKNKKLFPSDFNQGEDLIFNCLAFKEAKNIKTIPNVMYHYIYRQKDTMINTFTLNNDLVLQEKRKYVYDLLQDNETYYNYMLKEYEVFTINLFMKNNNMSFSKKASMISNNILKDDVIKKGVPNNLYGKIFKTIGSSYNAYFIVICYWILNVAKRSLGNVYLRIRKVIYKN